MVPVVFSHWKNRGQVLRKVIFKCMCMKRPVFFLICFPCAASHRVGPSIHTCRLSKWKRFLIPRKGEERDFQERTRRTREYSRCQRSKEQYSLEQDKRCGDSHVEWQLRMTERQIMMEPVASRSQTMKLWSLGVMTDDSAPWYPESGPKGAHSLGWLCPASFSRRSLGASPYSCWLGEQSGNTPSMNPGEAPRECRHKEHEGRTAQPPPHRHQACSVHPDVLKLI